MPSVSRVETGRILYSGQLSSTAPMTVFTVPDNGGTRIATATVCNISESPVAVSVALLQPGQSDDGTHTVIAGFRVGSGETVSISDYLGGATLDAGDSISVTASAVGAVNVALTGIVAQTIFGA